MATGETYGERPPEAGQIDWEAASRRARVAGTDLHFVATGPADAPPVVMIHGLSGSWLNWKLVMSVLAAGHRVVALDLPGYGGSPMPDAPITMELYATAIDALCEYLELGPVTLAGHSMGGYTAVEVAARHPERVARLALAAPAGIATATMHAELMIARMERLSRVARLVPQPVQRLLMRSAAWRARVLASNIARGDQLDWRTAAELAAGIGTPGYPGSVMAMHGRNIHEQAAKVSCPVLITWGQLDRVIFVKHAGPYQELFSEARLELFEDAGHGHIAEYPRSYAQLVAGFASARNSEGSDTDKETA